MSIDTNIQMLLDTVKTNSYWLQVLIGINVVLIVVKMYETVRIRRLTRALTLEILASIKAYECHSKVTDSKIRSLKQDLELNKDFLIREKQVINDVVDLVHILQENPPKP